MRNMFHRTLVFLAWLLLPATAAAQAQESPSRYDEPDPALDAAVEACLETEGVTVLSEHDSICYNSAIYPEQFLKLANLPETRRIIITSPGGNVATARMMSRIIDQRSEPVVIAGPCMSACAMVILPGADQLYIHRSAHIAVHGIAMMGFKSWFGWLKQGAAPSQTDFMMASLGYNLGYTTHKSGQDHMQGHLAGQHVDQAYIDLISERMETEAEAHSCRVDPNNYWGMIDAEHLQRFLGGRIVHMEDFDQSWDEPGRTLYRDITVPIAEQTYIFSEDYEDADCAAD